MDLRNGFILIKKKIKVYPHNFFNRLLCVLTFDEVKDKVNCYYKCLDKLQLCG